ncbi:MAG: PfkB family carbohydrate kinase [Solirubrobacteraceae bacterium]
MHKDFRDLRIAVIGHTESVTFVDADALPAHGEGIDVRTRYRTAAGGGAVAAMQLAALGCTVAFFTALGSDDLGNQARQDLTARGVTVHAARTTKTRQVLSVRTPDGERTIIHFDHLRSPSAKDPLPWVSLADCAGAYLCAGDEGAMHAGRQARLVVASARVADQCSGMRLDALIASESDALEQQAIRDHVHLRPVWEITTRGSDGGTYQAFGQRGSWPAAPLAGPVVDAYGAGDCFAAAVTAALAADWTITDALAQGAHAAAACSMRGRPAPPIANLLNLT